MKSAYSDIIPVVLLQLKKLKSNKNQNSLLCLTLYYCHIVNLVVTPSFGFVPTLLIFVKSRISVQPILLTTMCCLSRIVSIYVSVLVQGCWYSVLARKFLHFCIVHTHCIWMHDTNDHRIDIFNFWIDDDWTSDCSDDLGELIAISDKPLVFFFVCLWTDNPSKIFQKILIWVCRFMILQNSNISEQTVVKWLLVIFIATLIGIMIIWT